MTLEEALRVVEKRYGLGEAYVDEQSGRMLFVVKAERELRAIPEVKLPETGIALLKHEVIDLAESTKTIASLVREKNPELFVVQEVLDETDSSAGEEEFTPKEREALQEMIRAMSDDQLRKSLAHRLSEMEQIFRAQVELKLKMKLAEAEYGDRLRDR